MSEGDGLLTPRPACLAALLQPLKGEKLRKQLKKWSDYGTIEPSARDAIEYLIDNPKALDLSNKVPGTPPPQTRTPPTHPPMAAAQRRRQLAHSSRRGGDGGVVSGSCCWARRPPWART